MKNVIPKLLVIALLFCGAGTMMLSAKCSKRGDSRTSCDKDGGNCGKKVSHARDATCPN